MNLVHLACLACLAAAESEGQINPTPRPVLRETVAAWDFAKGTRGWTAEARCEVASSEGRLVVRTTGKDPYMHTRVDLAGGEMVLECRARSTAAGPAQIYWTTEQSPRRGEDKASGFEIVHDGQWHEYSVPFSAPGRLTDLRLDPADEAGLVEFAWIRLVRQTLNPLAIERVDVDRGAARFTVKNHDRQPRRFSAAGRTAWLEAGASQVFTIPLRRSGPVENVAFSASSEGLPEVGRSIFVYHDDLAPEWLELALAGGKLQIAPDGSAGRILHADQPVAVLAPLVHCEGRAARLAAAMTPEGIAVRGEGIDLAIAVSGSEIHFSIRGAQPCEGPVVRVLGGLEAGLLAGLEHLGRGEASSTRLDVETEAHLRFAPDPLLLTMPLMSIVTDRAAVSLAWDDMRLQPVFAAPNFFDAASDHRMALRGTKIEAVVRVARESLAEAIVWSVKRRGLPPLPEAPRTSRAQEALCLEGLNGPLKTGDGWGHCVEDRWPRRYFADMASTMFRLTGSVPREQKLVFGGSHISNPCIFLLANQAAEWRQRRLLQIDGILKRQQADGSFRYSGEYGRGHFEDTASGFCARPAVELLEDARITGDQRALDAAVRTLEYIKRFQTPRGAQVWEIPLHTPDQLAAAYLVWAYVRGYELTGNAGYLAEARRWAISGVPFVYQWSRYPVMLYGCVPVLGATNWRAPVWFGLPVQWVGIVYAYALAMLAPYDDALDWNHLAWGILLAGEQMQYPGGEYAGLLPDAFALRAQERRPWAINPCSLVSLRRVLEGKLDGIAVAAGGGHRVAAPFPIRIEGDQAVIEAIAGAEYQVIIDGRRIVGIRSKGRDVVDLAK